MALHIYQWNIHIRRGLHILPVSFFFFPDATERQGAVEIFKRIFENIEKIEIKALGGRKIILSLGACIYDVISAMIPFTAGQMQPCTGAKNNRDFVLRYMELWMRFLYLNRWAGSVSGYRPDAESGFL